MPVLIAQDRSQKSPIQFIHHKPEQLSPAQLELTISVDEAPEPPKVKPHQVARLYGNVDTGEHWWEVEQKPTLSQYEFWSLIPRQLRCDLRDSSDEYVVDSLFMLSLQKDVNMESDEVAHIIGYLDEVFGFQLDAG